VPYFLNIWQLIFNTLAMPRVLFSNPDKLSITRDMLSILWYNVNMWARMKDFFSQYEFKIVLFLGFILVAFISFEAGIMKGRGYSEKPIIIDKSPLDQVASGVGCENPPKTTKSTRESLTATNTSMPSQDCMFVGSKNSNKYHLPSCRWAKNIKAENLTCFKDKADAESKGYQADKNCIK
jgi:hypothetical protein